MSGNHLERDLSWFERHRHRLFELFPGKWIAVRNRKPLGVFNTYSEAYEGGIEAAQSEKILVKQILERDEVILIPSMWFVSA